MMQTYPLQCQELFLSQPQKQLTAAQVYELFFPVYSAIGSNAREKEQEIMMFWFSFLEECEGEDAITCTMCPCPIG